MTRCALVAICLALCPPIVAAADPTTGEALDALGLAVRFFQKEVAVEGSYVWRYSDDLSLREGEGAATGTMGWVQPPGTPAVGQAFLTAHERTGSPACLEAAVSAARSLVACQLASGGWDYRQEFDPAKRKDYAFRADQNEEGKTNVSTLDDDNTQSTVRFLMRIDRTLQFKDKSIHEAAAYALESLLKAQYPCGAWPQRYRGEAPSPAEFPVLKASYPAEWPQTWPNEKYSTYYTLNDDTLADCISLMFEAAEIYGDARYALAARRGGDFLILAQMPEPQPAWCQQYNAQMQPAWARKFEPPSVTGGESQGAIGILLEVYRQTGDRKYLEPISRALDYLEESQLEDGRLARFYELKTNRPLYFTKTYDLVYTDDDLPTHYGFIVGSKLERLRADYEKLRAADPAGLKPARKPPTYDRSPALAAAARGAIEGLDARGAWVEAGSLRAADPTGRVKRIITTQTFIKNLDVLSRYAAGGK